MGKAFATFKHPFWKQKKKIKIPGKGRMFDLTQSMAFVWKNNQFLASTSQVGFFLQGKVLACWERTWAGPRKHRDLNSANPSPSTSHLSCSVLELWRVNWADLWDGETGRRGGSGAARDQPFPQESRTSTLRLEEICSTILRPPASQDSARTEGKGTDLGRGQALSSGSSFTPHVPSSTPRWSF